MAFPYEEITAYAQTYKRPVMVDQIYKSNILFKRMQSGGRIIIDGGSQIEQPLEFAKLNGSEFDGAYETIQTSHKKIADYAVLQWKFYYAYADITLKDRTICRGKAQVINLADSRMNSLKKKMADQLGTDLYSDGTTALKMNGIAQGVDTGNTYAGIPQGTNSWWQAAGEDSTTTTLSLSVMQTGFGACYNNSSEYPTIIVTDQAEFNKFWTLVQPQQRFDQSSVGDQAKVGWKMSMLFNGIPIVPDNKCTNGSMFILNESHVKLFISPEADFKFTGWKEPVNQPAASIGFMLFAGNVLVDMPGSCYKFTALDD